MHPYKRSLRPTAPFYVQFVHEGRRYQLCTHETNYERAKIAGMRLKADVASGISKRAPTGHMAISRVTDLYMAEAVHVKHATRVQNVNCLARILRACGFSLESSFSVLTRKLVVNYQSAGLDEMTEEERTHAIISRNSAVRQARSLFSRRSMALYENLPIPDLSGFMKHPLLREPRKEYVPPPAEVIDRIERDAKLLKAEHPGAYVALLMQLYCGLRPSELLQARWSWVRHDASGYFLEVPSLATKTGTSRTIGLAQWVLEELGSVRQTEWLVPGQSDNARWKSVHRKLSPWLRRHGLHGTKSNYELRKLFGSKIATEHGLFAAQRALGHSKPSTTSDYYAAMLNRPKPVQPGSFGFAFAGR